MPRSRCIDGSAPQQLQQAAGRLNPPRNRWHLPLLTSKTTLRSWARMQDGASHWPSDSCHSAEACLSACPITMQRHACLHVQDMQSL